MTTSLAVRTLVERVDLYEQFIVDCGLEKKWAEYAGFDPDLMEVIG